MGFDMDKNKCIIFMVLETKSLTDLIIITAQSIIHFQGIYSTCLSLD